MGVTAAGLPRTVVARLWLGRLVLMGGLLLPLWPHWWAGPWPDRALAPSERAPRQEVPGGLEGDATDRSGATGTVASFRPRTMPTADQRADGLAAVIAGVDWRVVAAGAWLSGCGLLLARQAAGWWWLARVRRAASPVGGALLREFEAVRDDLGVGRRVVLLASGEVAGPALFAGRAPA